MKLNNITRTAEYVVSRPLMATLSVGGSILLLLYGIDTLSLHLPAISGLKYLVPFIPPFFITRMAKRINQRTAEYNFVRDAEPFLFLTYLDKVNSDSLSAARPEIVSESVQYHFGLTAVEMCKMEVLPARYLVNPEKRERMITSLAEQFSKNGGNYAVLNCKIQMFNKKRDIPITYILNTQLSFITSKKIKWQGTLLRDLEAQC
ncbi:MAG TPA: hypothetical protein VJ991_11125 [Balneolales bacterium]|nr:hypothetical protein [Balneolales bacterium]HYW94850.1 hypothetical protein [Bacteroidales bacterium]